MIRLFTILFKKDLSQLPSFISIYEEISRKFNISSAQCPNCNAKGHLTYHDSYVRNLVTYENNKVQENLIDVKRGMCSSCDTTHAILPDVIVPYKSYSIVFILMILKAYFFRKVSVVVLCESFGVSVTTLYSWKKRYLSQKKLYLGKLEKYLHEKDSNLSKPEDICFKNFLSDFFKKFGFSFLQYSAATKSGAG